MNGKTQAVAATWAGKTDLTHRLSYDSGVKNIVGVEGTNLQVRLRYTNTTDNDQVIYISPATLIGFTALDLTANFNDIAYTDDDADLDLYKKVLTTAGLPSGIPFAVKEYRPVKATTTKFVKAASLDPDQDLSLLASSMNETPIQIKSMIFRSFDVNGNPENTNYGNTLTHYNINAYREKKRQQPINMADYQSSKDFSTEILKINLLKNNIVVPISQEDVLSFKINSGTKMDITIDLGARGSRTERFFRDIEAGTQLLLSEFPQTDKSSCCC